MNQQKEDKTIEYDQRPFIEEKYYLQRLEKQTVTKVESPSASIVIFIDIQQRTAESQKRKEDKKVLQV